MLVFLQRHFITVILNIAYFTNIWDKSIQNEFKV